MRDNRACHAPTNVPDLVCTRGGKPPTAFWFVSVGNKHSTFIHSFISVMHHYECVAPNVDIILQSGRF